MEQKKKKKKKSHLHAILLHMARMSVEKLVEILLTNFPLVTHNIFLVNYMPEYSNNDRSPEMMNKNCIQFDMNPKRDKQHQLPQRTNYE
jgi:hypothetical protein